MTAYAASQVRELLARGPQEDEDFYRLQVTGNGSTNWVNVTPDELASIADVLDESGPACPNCGGPEGYSESQGYHAVGCVHNPNGPDPISLEPAS